MKYIQYYINNQKMKTPNSVVLVLVILFTVLSVKAQQDPQYTQYMYNTMSINPAYAGSRGHFSMSALARTQWVGVDGAPDTQTFSMNAPLGYSGVGLGLNIVSDKLGPSSETYFDANVSYTIRTSSEGQLAFGMRLGGRTLSLDWSKGRFQNQDAIFNSNLNNKVLPTIGAGVFFHKPKWYIGVSIPNFLRTDHYDDFVEAVSVERMHYFAIAGYVFDLTENIKFKPAILSKIVLGAPLSLDISANFLFNEKFSFGAAYRWGDAISAIVGFQITETLTLGYAYDLTTSNFNNYNSGSHEVMLTFNILEKKRLKCPRFF
jgi:type IX secretion system PorP/SprF family membrane protein